MLIRSNRSINAISKVNRLHLLNDTVQTLDECLMGWILGHIIIAIFGAREMYDKSMGDSMLQFASVSGMQSKDRTVVRHLLGCLRANYPVRPMRPECMPSERWDVYNYLLELASESTPF